MNLIKIILLYCIDDREYTNKCVLSISLGHCMGGGA